MAHKKVVKNMQQDIFYIQHMEHMLDLSLTEIKEICTKYRAIHMYWNEHCAVDFLSYCARLPVLSERIENILDVVIPSIYQNDEQILQDSCFQAVQSQNVSMVSYYYERGMTLGKNRMIEKEMMYKTLFSPNFFEGELDEMLKNLLSMGIYLAYGCEPLVKTMITHKKTTCIEILKKHMVSAEATLQQKEDWKENRLFLIL